ncbi:MAG: hypothetical protein EOO56_12125 [Hymenobacter sp.]|nr:MAG: hypothetical protein EOO56_12125 [Hymenobacter sp.]
MKHLSLFTRLLIIIAIVAVAGVYFSIISYDNGQRPTANSQAKTLPIEAAAAAPGEARGALRVRPAFNYAPLKPVGGKLRGVVELGASGFNSFIVRTDAHRNWQLAQAEFDNSLLMENMASEEDIRRGLRAYIVGMLDYGVAGRDIHFVVSSGALKVPATQRIAGELTRMGYVVNKMTAEKEAALGLSVAQPSPFGDRSFVMDIGSGGTEISWLVNGKPHSATTYGSKYFEQGIADDTVATDVKAKAQQVPARLRQTCFIIGGAPYEMAKKIRHGKERYTVLDAASAYQFDKAKLKSGLNIYRAAAEATGCKQFIFDWDANFTIGYLLALPQ